MRFVIAAVLLTVSPAVGRCWNDHGHMVVARIAWDQLTADERAAVVAVLKAHPHYDTYLAADRPEAFAADEWAFLRAATWADWVRENPKYDVPARHYINLPIVIGDVKPPRVSGENVVTGLRSNITAARGETDRTKQAVALTWVFHLVGDIHQPLHAATRYSPTFPTGDRGGNDQFVRIAGGRPVRLHALWDGLLGRDLGRAAILKSVLEAKDDPPPAADPVDPKKWADESHELAAKVAYQDGKLPPAGMDAPANVGEEYAKSAGAVARQCAARAGRRLAVVLKDVVAGPPR